MFARFSSTAREDVYQDPQQGFLLDRLRGSDASWNVYCSSVSHTAMVVDLAASIETLPIDPALRSFLLGLAQALGRPQILLNADQWDGFPNRRERLLDAYRRLGNVVMIAGDIHSSWVTDHTSEAGPLFEFTGTAISSATFSGLVVGALPAAASEGAQAQFRALAQRPGFIDALVQVISQFLIARQPGTRFRPDLEQALRFVDIARNGVVTVEADATSFRPTYWLLPSGRVGESFYDDRDAGLALFERRSFRVAGGRLDAL